MASFTPAVIQNENLDIGRGKGAPKPVKTGRQERKALKDLSHAGKPLPSAAKKLSTLKDKSAVRTHETVREVPKKSILKDDEISKIRGWAGEKFDDEMAKIREWSEEGIEHMNFTGNDIRKLEAQQEEERIKKKVNKALSGVRAWADTIFDLHIPVEDSSDDEFVLKEFVPEVLPPTPRKYWSSKLDYDDIEDLLKLDPDFLNFDHPLELKLKEEEYDSDTACL